MSIEPIKHKQYNFIWEFLQGVIYPEDYNFWMRYDEKVYINSQTYYINPKYIYHNTVDFYLDEIPKEVLVPEKDIIEGMEYADELDKEIKEEIKHYLDLGMNPLNSSWYNSQIAFVIYNR